MSFDLLFYLNAICLAIALARLRGATFIALANTATIIRALAGIEEFGQPRSQSFLPPAVFDPPRIESAANIFAIVTALGLVAVLLPSSKKKPYGHSMPALPNWL